MERGHKLARAIIALGILLAFCPCASALDQSLDVSQYAHTSWKIRDGFLNSTIGSMAQTPDGYLWLGTELGLFRFDGVKAVPWQPPPGQHLPDNYIRSLLVTRDGTLWIGTLNGLASWTEDGKFSQYPDFAGHQVDALLESREGTVWAGAGGFEGSSGRLCAIHAGTVECHGEDGSFGRYVESLIEDGEGNIWATSQFGLWRWKAGAARLYPMRSPVGGLQSLIVGDDGAILVASLSGLTHLVNGKFEEYKVPGGQRFRSVDLFRDHGGSLWIGTGDRGIARVHQGRTDVFSRPDGLSGETVRTFFEDREANLWVATAEGLDQFHELAVTTLTVNTGLSGPAVNSVLADKDGSLWFATNGGLNRWDKGRITVQKLNGLVPIALLQDHRGQIWIYTYGGLGYLQHGQFVAVKGVPSGMRAISSFVEDTAGNLWIADQLGGLFRLSPIDSKVQQTAWSGLGHQDPATSLLADPSQGGLWMGFAGGGVAYFKDGRIGKSYAVADGLAEGFVGDLRMDSQGALWVSTHGGLSRLKNGRIATLSSKNGLPCDAVNWTLEDDAHALWLYTGCGLVRIAHTELDAWASAVDGGGDKKRELQTQRFDSSDGVLAVTYPSGYSPRVARSSDGKLWFLPANLGVGAFDPHHLPFNNLVPPVHVERIVADRKAYDASFDSTGDAKLSLRLPPLIRDLQIDYAGLSLVAPEKNRFRVMLEGWDRDWQDAGNRRQAFYNNLPPGNYRFRVTASNNSGVWNEAGASLDFAIAPAYYQTNWFRLSCVIAFMAMLWGLYRLRVRQLAYEFNMGLEARVGERTRIARDLHDTLLQSFHGLLLRFQTVSNQLPPGEAKQSLDSAIDQAAQAITEGRDAVQGLRASTVVTNDLAVSISALGQELAAAETTGDPAVFRVTVEGAPRNLHPILRDEIYRIAAEAMRNAFNHAQARQIEVEIHYDDRNLRLRVRDDGKGIAPTVLGGDGRAGHFGLHGIRERAELMGGKLAVWSELDSGTEVELTVPATRAYTTHFPAHRSWLAKKLSGRFSGKGTAVKS